MKNVAIENDFYGDENIERKKSTKNMKRLQNIDPKLYFMPGMELINLEKQENLKYANLNLKKINPIIDNEHVIIYLLPKDDKPFYYDVRTAESIIGNKPIADYVFAKRNGNPFVNPKLYKFELFFEMGNFLVTTGISDMYNEAYRVMTSFDKYVNLVFFNYYVKDGYNSVIEMVMKYLENNGIVLNENQKNIVESDIECIGFPYVVSLFNKIGKIQDVNRIIEMDQFLYDENLVNSFRYLLMESSIASWYGKEGSDPVSKKEYANGEKKSGIYKKIFEDEISIMRFYYTNKVCVELLKDMFKTMIKVKRDSELDFLLKVFVARNNLCFSLAKITEILKNEFFFNPENTENYFDDILKGEAMFIKSKEIRNKVKELERIYNYGINGFNAAIKQLKEIYKDAIFIYDYTITNDCPAQVVNVDQNSVKDIMYISNFTMVDASEIEKDDKMNMENDGSESEEGEIEAKEKERFGIKLSKITDISGRSIIFTTDFNGISMKIILNNCSNIGQNTRSVMNITFENVIIIFNDNWFVQISNIENVSTPYYNAKFIYSYKDNENEDRFDSFVKFEINPGNAMINLEGQNPLNKAFNELFQTVIIIPAKLFGLYNISFVPVKRVDDSFQLNLDRGKGKYVITYKFNKQYNPCVVKVEMIEKDNNNKIIYDTNTELNDKLLTGLKRLSVNQLAAAKEETLPSLELDETFGEIGKSSDNVIKEVVRMVEEEKNNMDFGSFMMSRKKKKEESKPKKVIEIKASDVAKAKELTKNLEKEIEQN